ncbi:hypothetical protein PENTCL1PPCAC_29127, partial [Pristionchus entomophagus]
LEKRHARKFLDIFASLERHCEVIMQIMKDPERCVLLQMCCALKIFIHLRIGRFVTCCLPHERILLYGGAFSSERGRNRCRDIAGQLVLGISRSEPRSDLLHRQL